MFAAAHASQSAKETLYVESQTARRDSTRSGESCPFCRRARDPPVVYILVCWKNTGLLQGLRSVGMQRKLPVGGYFAVFRRCFVGLEMMWAVREFQSTKAMILLILPLGGSSYRVSEYIPLVVMHASSIHESFISRQHSRTFLLVVILITFSR